MSHGAAEATLMGNICSFIFIHYHYLHYQFRINPTSVSQDWGRRPGHLEKVHSTVQKCNITAALCCIFPRSMLLLSVLWVSSTAAQVCGVSDSEKMRSLCWVEVCYQSVLLWPASHREIKRPAWSYLLLLLADHRFCSSISVELFWARVLWSCSESASLDGSLRHTSALSVWRREWLVESSTRLLSV